MRILLVNDDGINAAGISSLAKRFSREHEVYIVAPDTNKSAASCSMIMARPLALNKVQSESLPSVAAYSLAGTPVDCSLSAICGEYIPEVDVVVSGINDGPNIGTDVVFSGTCGAARQACLLGVPGIALSVDCNSYRDPDDKSNDLYYDSLADFACRNLDRLIALCGEKKVYGDRHVYDCFVNVNSPCLKKYKGAKLTNPCLRRYWDKIILEKKEDGSMTSMCSGEAQAFSYGDEIADFKATESGYVSVSSVYTDTVAVDLRGMENNFIL
ncbi:MAG: 5'/3'-nucleotidase SurE [Treponema sp.]|nr:5'/3'-nucleotidase SurE [Candidatus Treponema equi]